MIQPYKELHNMSDEEYAELEEKPQQEIRNYLDNNFLYEFVALCIATDFKYNAIWDNTCLELQFKDAISFLENMPKYNKLNFSKFKEILKEKYSLEIINTNPLEIKKY